MAQVRAPAKYGSLVVNVTEAETEANGYSYPTSPIVRSPITPRNPKLENRLKEAWQKAEKEFLRETGRSLGSYNVKSKDGILRDLKQKYDSDDTDTKKSSTLNLDTFEKVLNAVTIVGAFAAQGASMVFGPADMCFNAISFLLAVPGQIKKVYDELAALFEEIEMFLTKFKIYSRIEDGSGMGDELFENTNNLLTCLVRVCAIASKVLQGGWRDRMKNNLRVVLLQDDRVGGALGEFRKLCRASDSLANTVMLEHVMSSEQDVKAILSSTQKMQSGIGVLVARSNDEKTSLVNRDRLNLIKNRLFAHQLTEDLLSSAYQENNEETLEALQAVDEYKQWIDDDSARSALVIFGPSGSGKSYMLEAVREHLNTRRESAQKGEPSIYVAKHTFDDSRAKTIDDQSKSAANKSATKADAVRRIAYQVAMQSTNFTKELATLLSDNSSLKSEKDSAKLFEALKLSQFPTPSGATMYILLDGIGEDDIVGELKILLNLFMAQPTQEGLQIKMLIAMNSTSISPPLNQWVGFSVDRCNQRLLSSFAREEMQRKDFLQDSDRETRTFRDLILGKLTSSSTDVTFKSIRQKLAQLQEAIDEDRPQPYMSKILEADIEYEYSADAGLKILQELAKTLTERGVQLLNKILTFTLFADGRSRDLDEIEALLRLDGVELPIEPLGKKIRRTFSKVLCCSSDYVYLNYEPEAALLDMARPDDKTKMPSSNDPRINLNITINNATEQAVRKFVWDLNEQMSTGKFDFALSKAQAAPLQIRVNEVEGHLNLLSLCFKLISQGWDDDTKVLVDHVYDHIPYHLTELHTLESHVSLNDRKMIGDGIINFLTDTYYMKMDQRDYGYGHWMVYEDQAAAVRFWLEDKATFDALRPKEQRWLTEMTDRSLGKIGFMKDMAVAVSHQWLTDVESPSYVLYCWLNNFLEGNTPFPISPEPSEIGSDDHIADPPEAEKAVESASIDHEELKEEAKEETNDDAKEEAKEDAQAPVDVAESAPVEDPLPIEKDEKDADEATPTVELTLIQKIDRAAAWAKEQASIIPSDTYYTALGSTYYSSLAYAEGLSQFEKVSSEYADRYLSELGKALCLIDLKEPDRAMEHARVSIDQFRTKVSVDALSEGMIERYLKSMRNCGDAFVELERFADALLFYEEITARKPNDWSLHWTVIKLHCQTGDQKGRGKQLLIDWTQDKSKFGDKDPSNSVAESIEEYKFYDVILNVIREVTAGEVHDLLANIMDEATRLAISHRDPVARINLQYLQAVMHTLQPDPTSMARALSIWKDIVDNCVAESDPNCYKMYSRVRDSADYWLRYEFDTVRVRVLEDGSLSSEGQKTLIGNLQRTIRRVMDSTPALRGTEGYISPETFIVNLYSAIDPHAARQLLKNDMASALEILSDSDPDNDTTGLEILMRVFCALNDRVGVLSALSLCDRNAMRQKVKGETIDYESDSWNFEKYNGLYRSCDGCRLTLFSADHRGIWWCPFCPGTSDWCGKCKVARESGKLKLEECSRDHVSSYIHLVHPTYTEEDLEGNKVLVDWEYESDGEGNFKKKHTAKTRTIELEQWVEELRTLWDLPKPDGDGSRAQQ